MTSGSLPYSPGPFHHLQGTGQERDRSLHCFDAHSCNNTQDAIHDTASYPSLWTFTPHHSCTVVLLYVLNKIFCNNLARQPSHHPLKKTANSTISDMRNIYIEIPKFPSSQHHSGLKNNNYFINDRWILWRLQFVKTADHRQKGTITDGDKALVLSINSLDLTLVGNNQLPWMIIYFFKWSNYLLLDLSHRHVVQQRWDWRLWK